MNTRQRLAKLRAMSPGEIASRAAYEVQCRVERAQYRKGTLAPEGRLRAGLVPSIGSLSNWRDALMQQSAMPVFFGCAAGSESLRHAFRDRFAAEADNARRVASAVRLREVQFFGSTFQLGTPVQWHADPVTGAVWPPTYHRDVPVNTGRLTYGDVKFVWELNRHQFFVDLAKAALLDGCAADRNTLRDLFVEWNKAVPYATGAPWACALEPAFRAWSWLWSYHMLQVAGLLTDDDRLAWLTGLYDHGRFLYRHLETHTSPYNHLVGEASALFALGVLFPQFREAGRWASRGHRVLESTLESQFYADGGTVEQSFFYHHATLGFYMLSAILGRQHGADLSRDVWAAIERGLEFSMSVMQPDGRVPSVGGADDGKPIRLEHVPFWDFRPYLAAGAVLFSRGDFKRTAGRFWEDAMWLLGPDAAHVFDRLDASRPPVARALPSSGYYVMRSDWDTQADYLCFDCGEQAGGLRHDDVPSAAHGHADCLSVILNLDGRPVLADPGFYCYNGDPEWEVHFRRTGAHNTITVDGRDQAHHVSKMAWTHTYSPHLDAWCADGDIAWVSGSHDGYTKGDAPVEHRRSAWLRPGGYAIVFDELRARGEHHAAATFQFAPGRLVLDGRTALLDDRFELTWIGTVPVTATVATGGSKPSAGWIAPSLGRREPAPRLLLEFDLRDGAAGLLTVVTDRQRSVAGVLRLEHGALVGCVDGPGWRDALVANLDERKAGDAPLDVTRTPLGMSRTDCVAAVASESLVQPARVGHER